MLYILSNTLIYWGVINIKDYNDLVVDYRYYDNQSLWASWGSQL